MLKKGTYRFLRYWLPVLIYCFMIFVQSSHPAPKEIPEIPYFDKVLHLAGYALLGILFLRGFVNSRLSDGTATIKMASIFLTGLYGATDELHQHYVPFRTADIWDVFFDVSGGFIGVYLYQILLEKYPKIGRI
ncbi:MAG: VanZ family protein [Desulfobacterales bacterium]|nr:VanZ family protein [Desulfobacterales bacterium]